MVELVDAKERKEKVLSFLEKDIFIVNNYESAPFKNKNHAIECLIPYHIFQAMVEDVKFKGSDVVIDPAKGLEVLRRRVTELYTETFFRSESFTPHLLLYHEQRYINSLLKQKMYEREEARKSGTSLIFRIKRARNLSVYGHINRLRIQRGNKKK